MALAHSAEPGPQRRPTLASDEQRIADAVVAALEPGFASLSLQLDEKLVNHRTEVMAALELRFASLSLQLDEKFVNHMTEIEGYYAERDRGRDEDLAEIKGDLKAILEALGGEAA